MAAAPDLVCMGHLVKEMIHFPDRVEGPFLGSPPAYCAVAAARQGTATGLVSEIGPDMPDSLLAPLREARVDTAGLRLGECTTASELLYDRHGNKEIRYPSTAAVLMAAHIPPAFRGCRLLYVCTMDNDVPLAHLGEVVAQGQASAVDLGGYGGVHMSLAHRQAVPSLVDLACAVSSHFAIVKASDEDARAIFGGQDLAAAAQRLLDCGPQIAIITLGPRGVLVATPAGHWQMPALPVAVADTTGGGDAFMAGFLSEYIRSKDPVQAARWGCATAGWVIQEGGGVRVERMPTRAQIDALLRRYAA
jgi:sugar/nucleoside kinase (ribokinase family)